MAHNITDRDGLFSVREPMWHGLGTVLPDHPTREEAKEIAHPWEPVSEPLYREVPGFTDDGEPTSTFEKVESHVANIRSDTGDLLGVTSSTYELVKNEVLYDIAEALESEGNGEVQYETGGSLKGGAKVWLLMRLKDPLVLRDDAKTATIPYYALQNNHDGLGSFRGQATLTRIVCDNTAQMADLDARQRGTEFTFRHTMSVKDRIEEAKVALAGWRESVEAYQALSEHLLDSKVSPEGVQSFLEHFIPEPMGDVISERVRNNVIRSREAWTKCYESETCDTITGSAYGILQASIEYLNHERRANSQEGRFRRTFLDRSQFTSRVVSLAEEAALV